MTLALDDRPHLEDTLDYGFVVDCLITKLGGRRHDQELHSFPEVKVQVLIPTSHKASNFITIDEEGDEFALFNASIYNDLMEWSGSFPHIVDGGVLDLERGHWEVSKLNTLVHHTHGSEETRFNVILYVLGPYFSLMHKGIVLGARTCR